MNVFPRMAFVGAYVLLVSLFVQAEASAGEVAQRASKSGSCQHCGKSAKCRHTKHTYQHPHKWHLLGPPPPMAPILDSSAILRVPAPARVVRDVQDAQDAAPESAPPPSNDVQQRIAKLERTVNSLTAALDALIKRLEEEQ